MKRRFVLLAQISLYFLAEGYLFTTYQHHDARFHWFTHFLAGSVFALLLMTLIAYRRQSAVRWPLLWLLAGHIFAMLPDILFNIWGIIHQPWMNVFLLHIDGHFIPGRNVTWYVLFMLTLGMYLALLAWIERKPAKQTRAIRNVVSITYVNTLIQLILGAYLFGKIEASFSPLYLLAAAILVIITFSVLGPFMHYFYKNGGIKISQLNAIKLIFATEGLSKLIPLGDYFLQRHLLAAKKKPEAKALDYIIVLYSFAILGLIILFLICQVLVSVFYPNQITGTFAGKFSYIPIFFTACLFIGFLLRRNVRLKATLKKFFIRYLKEQPRSPFKILTFGSRQKWLQPWLLPLILTWVVEGLAYYACMQAFGSNPPILLALYVYTFVKLFRFVPLFPAGVGEIEGVSAVLFAAYGYPLLPIITGAIAFRLLSYWLPVIFGALFYKGLQRKSFE